MSLAPLYTDPPWCLFHCEGEWAVMPACRPGDICTGITNEGDARLLVASPALVDLVCDMTDHVPSHLARRFHAMLRYISGEGHTWDPDLLDAELEEDEEATP